MFLMMLFFLAGIGLLTIAFGFYTETPGSARAGRWLVAALVCLALGLLCGLML